MTEDYISSTHPLLPPTTEDERLSWLRLLRSRRVGISTFYKMMAQHGSARAALDALPRVANDAGLNDYRVFSVDAARSEMAAADREGARMVCRGEHDYPSHLAEIPDPPPFIWVRGHSELLRRPVVALVGARNASSLGLRMARHLAGGLGDAGYVVVSGLARGIDTEAHRETLGTGTIGVVGGGVDVVYPRENADLMQAMAQKGVIISEQPMGLAPQARHFPARNRIIAGLALATVVVEAAAKSGSLITARTALDQGRDVLAVPGHPFDARASGCNILLRDGAKLVRGPEDVIETLPPIVFSKPPEFDINASDPVLEMATTQRPPKGTGAGEKIKTKLRAAAALHQAILNRLSAAPLAEDQLVRDLKSSSAEVAPALTLLELDGEIERQSGGTLVRAPMRH
ncbi:MAG: DNA-processing protein DprA [Pseudoprimorskyibacter sp.]|nr:DNA-processing protein DprA [Pseudoprimorskyibacter sp.]